MQLLRTSEIEVCGIYTELLRAHSLSLGMYVHRAGTGVVQDPHWEDEVYVVLSGRGTISVEDQELPIGEGSVIFVPARAPHYFHSVTEDLRVLVMFSPPEGSNRALQG